MVCEAPLELILSGLCVAVYSEPVHSSAVSNVSLPDSVDVVDSSLRKYAGMVQAVTDIEPVNETPLDDQWQVRHQLRTLSFLIHTYRCTMTVSVATITTIIQ